VPRWGGEFAVVAEEIQAARRVVGQQPSVTMNESAIAARQVAALN